MRRSPDSKSSHAASRCFETMKCMAGWGHPQMAWCKAWGHPQMAWCKAWGCPPHLQQVGLHCLRVYPPFTKRRGHLLARAFLPCTGRSLLLGSNYLPCSRHRCDAFAGCYTLQQAGLLCLGVLLHPVAGRAVVFWGAVTVCSKQASG